MKTHLNVVLELTIANEGKSLNQVKSAGRMKAIRRNAYGNGLTQMEIKKKEKKHLRV